MSFTYPFSHSADTVFNLFCDPDFLVDRALSLGEITADAEVEDSGSKVIVTMRREVIRELPKFLAKLFNPKQVLHLTETWQKIGDSYTGKAEFTVEGQPVSITTTTTLKPTTEGSEFSISYKAKANIPLIGGRVEKFIISNCEDGTKKEMAFTQSRLAEVAAT